MASTEALRLAAVPIFDRSITWQSQATIELRRLSAENDRLESERDEARRTVREAHEAGTRLTAQRDALLEALKAAEPYLRHANVAYNVYVQARAAIKAVEEEA